MPPRLFLLCLALSFLQALFLGILYSGWATLDFDSAGTGAGVNERAKLIGPGCKTEPDVSMIIPLHRDGPRFRRCLDHHRVLSPKATYEIIVVSDRAVVNLPKDVVYVSTGSASDTSPALKRDIGGKLARGRVFAYIDDDAYASPDWIDQAVDALASSDVHAVGGPGVTPPGRPWRERLGGAVYESRLGTGPLRHRFVSMNPKRDSDDLPAYNLVVTRSAIEAVGGWDSSFYGGEDTKLCLKLRDHGYRLRYIPSMVVFHHRRPVLRSHLRQIGNVGLHRGFFVKRYPPTSRRLVYFLPAVGTIAALPGIALVLRSLARAPLRVFKVIVMSWLFLALCAVRKAGVSALLFPGVLVAHHMSYGWNFIRGLIRRDLVR